MNAYRMTVMMAATLATMTATAASAKLSAEERARLEREVEVQRSVTRDYEASAAAYDRAYKAAKGIDLVIGHTAGRVPGGSAAYKGGKLIGSVGAAINERRKR